MSESKTRKPKAQRRRTAKKPRAKPQAIANYGANESRRVCHACGSAESTCTSVRTCGKLKIRYRICGKCGAKRTTQEVVATA